jgi:chaperonin GroES
MKLRPLGDRVIVKRIESETKALSVKVGDRVLFGKYSGQTVKVGGDELLVMKEEDLFAVVE